MYSKISLSLAGAFSLLSGNLNNVIENPGIFNEVMNVPDKTLSTL